MYGFKEGFFASGIVKLILSPFRSFFDGSIVEKILAQSKIELKKRKQPFELETDLSYPGSPNSKSDIGGKTIRRLLQIFDRDPIFRIIFENDRFLEILKNFIGPEICLSRVHHNCVMTKHPKFSSSTGWHQDIRYWSFEKNSLITSWIPLSKEDNRNGSLKVIPGSHKYKLLNNSFDNEYFFKDTLESNKEIISKAKQISLKPTDLMLFHCKLLHSASSNLSRDIKYSLVYTYHTLDNKPLKNSRSSSKSFVGFA